MKKLAIMAILLVATLSLASCGSKEADIIDTNVKAETGS